MHTHEFPTIVICSGHEIQLRDLIDQGLQNEHIQKSNIKSRHLNHTITRSNRPKATKESTQKRITQNQINKDPLIIRLIGKKRSLHLVIPMKYGISTQLIHLDDPDNQIPLWDEIAQREGYFSTSPFFFFFFND